VKPAWTLPQEGAGRKYGGVVSKKEKEVAMALSFPSLEWVEEFKDRSI
jgi:hypothetical protein